MHIEDWQFFCFGKGAANTTLSSICYQIPMLFAMSA